MLRGSRDGFTPKKFHELCDNKYNTVTFIKVKGTEEILGGYNPIIWSSTSSRIDGWGKTKDSFIFSFKNKDNFFKDVIISNVIYADGAILNKYEGGPCFGKDIIIVSRNGSTDYSAMHYSKSFYEKKIRDTEGYFFIEDYEVFQIIER